MKKRAFLSIFLTLALMTGIVPAAAAELPVPEGLSITWYTDYEGLMRRYGTDRMLLVKDGKSGLFGLDGTKYTDCVFDAFGTFNGSGLAPACLNGKWGMVDLDGKTVVEHFYDTQAEAEAAGALTPVSQEIVDEDALHEGLRRIWDRENDRWGYVDAAGEQVAPYVFDAVGYFDHGVAAVKSGDTFGLLKNPLLEPEQPTKPQETPRPNTPAAPISFTDVPAGSWFEQGVMTCARNGVMVGVSDSEFAPNAALTDAECAMLAYRIYDKANGGDGSLMKMPEGYGYLKLVSDDGSFVHEGYAGDRAAWALQNVYLSSEGYRMCPVGYDAQAKLGAVTVTFGGKEYRGKLERVCRGSGKYESDWFTCFEPEDAAFNQLMMEAYRVPSPDRWWAGLVYTAVQTGREDVLPYMIYGREASRSTFAEILGGAVTLPKRFDVPSIPDGGEREWGGWYEPAYTLYEAGIIGGVDAYGTFEPDKPLTRAEAAVMVARVLDESQRLTQPPKPMPKDGEGYILTYLMDGAADSAMEKDTYPYFFVEDPALDWPQRHKGLLKLDGTFMPWPESERHFVPEWYGGDIFFWTNIYENEDGTQRSEVGALNDELEWVIQPQYLALWPCEGGFAAVTNDERYLLLDEAGAVVDEVASEGELPERPGYQSQWTGWENWGGLEIFDENMTLGWKPYYRWPDGSPATEHFDWCGKIGPDGRGFVQKDGKIYRIEFAGAEGKTVTQAGDYQAALSQVTIEGIQIGVPFDELPQELRAALQPQGEPYDSGVFNKGEEIGRRYAAPGIEVVTSAATEKVLQRALEGQDKEYLLKKFGSEDWQVVYEQEKGREYVDTVILTGDSYRMASGLKVGDSGEKVRELGYPLQGETYGETVGFDGSVKVYVSNDVVTQIEACDCLGRRIGPFMDP